MKNLTIVATITAIGFTVFTTAQTSWAQARLFDMNRTFTVAKLRNYAKTTPAYEQGAMAVAEAAKRATIITSTHWLQATQLPGDTVIACGHQINEMNAWRWIRFKGELPDKSEVVAAVTGKTLNMLLECLQNAEKNAAAMP